MKFVKIQLKSWVLHDDSIRSIVILDNRYKIYLIERKRNRV